MAVAALLYCIFQIRLHKRWSHRLCMAVHPLRSAFWHPTDVCLDRAGRLFGNRPSVVSAELYYWRSDRRFRPGLATAGVYLVYSLDHLSTVHNRGTSLYSRIALWKCGKRPLHRWKTNIYDLMEKLSAFPTARKHCFPQRRPFDRLHTFPQRLLLLLKMSAITER